MASHVPDKLSYAATIYLKPFALGIHNINIYFGKKYGGYRYSEWNFDFLDTLYLTFMTGSDMVKNIGSEVRPKKAML